VLWGRSWEGEGQAKSRRLPIGSRFQGDGGAWLDPSGRLLTTLLSAASHTARIGIAPTLDDPVTRTSGRVNIVQSN
jgi:hypothetical protein